MFVPIGDGTEITFEYAKRSIDEFEEEVRFVRVDLIADRSHVTCGMGNDVFAIRGLKNDKTVPGRLNMKSCFGRSANERTQSSKEDGETIGRPTFSPQSLERRVLPISNICWYAFGGGTDRDDRHIPVERYYYRPVHIDLLRRPRLV